MIHVLQRWNVKCIVFNRLKYMVVLYISTCNIKFLFLRTTHLFIVVCTSEADNRSIEALYSKSYFICFMPCSKPSEKWAHKLSVSRQIIKPQGRRAGFMLDTISICQWPFICTRMKTDRDSLFTATFQVMQFTSWVKLTLLPPLLPHYCLISPYHSVSVLCLKHHPSFSSSAHRGLISLSRFAQRARFALAVAGRLWCGLTMWLVPLLNLIILAS